MNDKAGGCSQAIDAFAPSVLKTKPFTKGGFCNESFDLLIAFTSIRSEPLIEALRDYFVVGLEKSQAYTKHSVDKTIFSRKLPLLEAAFNRAVRFYEVYSKE